MFLVADSEKGNIIQPLIHVIILGSEKQEYSVLGITIGLADWVCSISTKYSSSRSHILKHTYSSSRSSQTWFTPGGQLKSDPAPEGGRAVSGIKSGYTISPKDQYLEVF